MVRLLFVLNAIAAMSSALNDQDLTYYDLPILPFVTPCVCSNEWWNASYYKPDSSCRCDGGIKQISLQYTGDTILSSLIFYHSGDRFYENCTFRDVQPREVVTCISYPYSQFDRDLHIQAIGVDDANSIESVCDNYIDVSCAIDILDAHSTQCSSLPVVGFVDVDNYVCDAPTSSDGNSDGKGRRRRSMLMLHRRLLSSSDSSDSSSQVQSQVTGKPTPKPTSKPTMKPTSTAKPTTLAPLSSPQSTVSKPESPTAPTFVNISAHVLLARECNCDSFDSWDDTHDVVNGEIVKFIQDPQDQSYSFDDMDASPARAQDSVQSPNMQLTAANDANYCVVGYILIINMLICTIFVY